MDLHFDLTQTQHVSVLVEAGIETRLPTLLQSMKPDGVVVIYDTALEILAKRIAKSLTSEGAQGEGSHGQGAMHQGLGTITMLPVGEGESAKRLAVNISLCARNRS